MIDVDDKQNVGQRMHFLDTAEAAFKFIPLAGQTKDFFLGEAVECAVFGHLLQHQKSLYGLANRLVIGQHAAEPALRYEGHSDAPRVCLNRLASRTLRANKHDFAAIGDRGFNKSTGFARQWQTLFEIDDVDFVTIAKDVGGHLWVPVTGLMTEMHASL